MSEQLCVSNKRTNIFLKEYLKNKSLSIMTDNEPEIDNVCLRKKGQRKTRTNHSTSSSNSNSSDSFIYVAVEEVSAVSEWESVTKDEITESIRVNSVSQKYCNSKSNNSWYLKLKREILKSLRNKIYPVAIVGNKGSYKMAHFHKMDEKHPYYAIAAARMWQKPETKAVTTASIYWKFAAFNFIHKRVQETDGGFFENLGTLLAEKVRAQEQMEGPLPKKKEEIEAEDEDNLSEEGSIEEPSEALLETDSDRDEKEHAQNFLVESVGLNIEELYTALVYMTQHQIGYDVSNECGQEALLNHLQNAFKIDNETHERILEETQNMEAPEMHLNVEVIEAKELVSKDANGKSDPFCALYLESAPTRRYNTAVKTSTLSPVWEEHFELPLEDPENDVLSLEVWDFDAAETVPEKISKVKDIKGVRGLVKLAKEIAVTATTGNHDNEFIGRCRIPLKDIPTTGHMMWYPLEKKNKSKRRGVVKLKLAFSAEHNAQVAAQEHRHLLRVLLLYELETEKVEKYCWCGRWSGPAEALILQHSAQRGLLARNIALAQWIEYARIHQEHPLNFMVFNKLIVDLLRPMDNGLFSTDETKLFWDATRKLLYSCLNSIRKIRRFILGDKNATTQLSAILGILSSIATLKIPEDFDLFLAKMYPWFPEPDGTKLDVIRGLENTVIQGGVEWFEHIASNTTPETKSDEDTLRYYIKVIQLIRADLQRSIDYYDKLFIKKINFPYTRTLYIMYEKKISDMCMEAVEDVCARLKHIEVDTNNDSELSLGTTLFELYLTLQRYAILGQIVCAEGQLETMKIQNYHDWFKAGVAHWLDIAVYKAIKRIDRAVEFDTLQAIDNTVQYTSSAVDTLTIFYQIKVFWTQLAWPDVEGSYTFVTKIIDKRRPPSFYSNLHRTLHTLIRFFNLGADETSNVQVLEKIEELLKLHGLETAELIHRYNQDRLREQKEMEETIYGLLTVKAWFLNNSLNIQILNARNLRPMDSNGDFIGKLSTLERKLHSKSKQRLKEAKKSKCDSYVKIRLLPEEKFIDNKTPKTHVQKETLFPLFDETFNIPLTEEQRAIEDAIVAFEIKDKDFLRTRFMAEAFLSFREIPEVGPEKGMESMEQIHLKLSRPNNKSTDVIRALEHRKGDNQAMDFISKMHNKSNAK
ncbi:protein unc-13 homolog 4B isoform X9 [Vespa velutina]|uniref:protein unc-13 homolog 4B isoform X9 n=1 Tax=Vespa velutina TaxID=202808 RepID=UPI001FB4C616|nr:protein unc-13 homolog 4B isoform X9 [Vespa velutina]